MHLSEIWRTAARRDEVVSGLSSTALLFTILVLLLLMLSQARAFGEPLAKSVVAFEQEVPLAVIRPGETKAECVKLGLKWNPTASSSTSDEPISFQINSEATSESKMNLRSQGWIAASSSAMAWQQPWARARWEMQSAPPLDEAVSGALGVGMIATAANVAYPSDTLVIACLNPDSSLGPVSGIQERIDAASRAGYRKVIIPYQQRMEKSAYGNLVNMEGHAKQIGLQCIPAKDLSEAVHHVLNIRLEPVSPLESPPVLDTRLTEFLEKECRRELDRLQTLETKYSEASPAFAKQKQSALTAYRAGQFYAALMRLKQVNAALSATAELPQEKNLAAVSTTARTQLGELQQTVSSLIRRSDFDKDDINSAFAIAERNDWIFQLQARIEGTQGLADQALPANSDATEEYKSLARQRLVETAAYSRSLLEDKDFFSRLQQALPVAQGSRVNRSRPFLPQLMEAHVGSAELLGYQLKESANILRESLLLDPRLVAQAKLLQELRSQRKKQEEQEQRLRDLQIKRVGFTPGSSYQPPEPPAAPRPVTQLSDTARSMSWVNDYCEIAALTAKYRKLDGRYDTTARKWVIGNPGALESMLIQSEIGARRGIALAQKAGVDPTVLCLIYEHASSLRVDEDDNQRLEALRHYWRCSLMGNLAWQFATPPPAQPKKPAEEPQVIAQVSHEPAPPQTAAAVPVHDPEPEPGPARPFAIPALPVTDAELEYDQGQTWRY